jgi:hypothetical protein
LTFWACPAGLDFSVKLPLARVAQILARACGHIGSGADYLFQTVSKLKEFDIRDRNLWRLQQLVADEILQMTESAESDSQAWRDGELVIVQNASHSAADPGMSETNVAATDRLVPTKHNRQHNR